MRPGTRKGNVEMITIALGAKTRFAVRTGTAVSGNPVTEYRLGTLKTATGGFGVIPVIVPDTVY